MSSTRYHVKGSQIIRSVFAAFKRLAVYKSKRLAVQTFLLLCALGCLLSAPGQAREPVKIGVSLGLTGRFDVMSNALYKGFNVWQDHLNAAGGVLGRPVRVIYRDDQGLPDKARSLYIELIEEEKVDFLFAPYSSLLTEAVLPIAERYDIPILIAGAAADRLWEKGFRNVVGVYTPASKFPVGFLELLVLHDLDNIALVCADDPFSVDLADSTKDWAKRFVLKLVLFETFTKGTEPLDPIARKAKEKGADVLMVCGHMDEAVNMTQALKRIHWRPKAFYASVGPALEAFRDRCGGDVEGVFATSLWEPRAGYPGAQKFAQDFTAAYGETPGYHAGLAYAAGQALAESISEAGSIDRDRVRTVLFNLDTMTIIGRFGVDPTGKQLRQHAFIIQWQNGHKELVWPQSIKTAEPRF